jgi:DNA-binding CsgD family transcriptional regulator
VEVTRALQELLDVATTSASLDGFRTAALALLRDALDADVGLFATIDRGVTARADAGLDAELTARLDARWDAYGREIRPVQLEALRVGAATDVRILGDALRRTRVHRDVMAPAAGTESLFLVPALAGRHLGFVMLGRCGGRRFSEAALAHARTMAPALALACAAIPTVTRASAPRLPALSDTEADLLRYLELGYTSREIALARGTSPYTVRNQLSALYRKLGVTNRTEAVGLVHHAR